MAKQLTKTELLEQNEALSDQVDGLQSEVEELDATISEVYDHNGELQQRNDALQSSLVAQADVIAALEDEAEVQDNLLDVADFIIQAAGEFEKVTSAKIAELEQENFHLTIQLAAAKDRVNTLEASQHTPVTFFHRSREFTNSDYARTATGRVPFTSKF